MLLWQAHLETTQTVGWIDILSLLGQTIVALLLVCGIAVLILRYLLPKFNSISSKKSIIQIIDNVGLDMRKRLVLVEVVDKYLLIAVSENGVQMITELNTEEVQQALKEISEIKPQNNTHIKETSKSFKEILGNLWKQSR